MKPTYKEFIELELVKTKNKLEAIGIQHMLAQKEYETKREMLIERRDKLEKQLR